jgi:hypothetical protein
VDVSDSERADPRHSESLNANELPCMANTLEVTALSTFVNFFPGSINSETQPAFFNRLSGCMGFLSLEKSPGLTGLLLILFYKIRAREPFSGILLSFVCHIDFLSLFSYSQRPLKMIPGTFDTSFSDP